jgi:hypothetical protein
VSDDTTTLDPSAYELAVSIAKHMTGPARWAAKRRETMDDNGKRYAELVRLDDGAELGVTVGGYRQEGRATFRAHWPKYHDGQTYSPREYLSVTCSARRDPKALAKDIERRLLAEYDPAYKRALEEVRASDAAAGVAWQAAERIAEAIGAELPAPERRPNNGAAVSLHRLPDEVYNLKVHPSWGDRPVRVSFDVHDVDEATALEVLALIARRQTKS